MEGQILLETTLNDDGSNETLMRLYETGHIILSVAHFGGTPVIVPLDRSMLRNFLEYRPDPQKPPTRAVVATQAQPGRKGR